MSEVLNKVVSIIGTNTGKTEISKNAALAVTPYVILKNDKNEDVTDLPIMLCGNKLEIAKLLYDEHKRQNRALTQGELENLLYFAFGSKSMPVAQWLIDTIKVDAKARLEWYRKAGGQDHTDMLKSLGLIE